jgi:Rap1a immunity proteins
VYRGALWQEVEGGLWYAVLGFAVVACLAMTLNAFGEESLPRTPKLLTAKGFVDYYRSNREHDVAKIYVRGVLDGFRDADSKVTVEMGRDLFCWPQHIALVEDQLISIVAQTIERHAKLGEMPFSTVAALALTDAFPCKTP